MATLEYAGEGLVGVLTPQANTTVEPEFNILWPAGVAMINARLTSPKQSMVERLADYAGQIETTLDQFANAPIDAAAFACTGASYLIGKDREAALCAKIEKARHYPLVTAARAVCEWLNLLQAKQIGLVSPYPPDLTGQSAGYWQGAGFEVAKVVSVFNEASEFHPIYSLSAGDAGDGLDALADKNLDAIVMLGTGMPTLRPILERNHWHGPPITSCMLSLAWRTSLVVQGQQPSAENAMAWSRGEAWGRKVDFLASA